ncbi:TetR/AcrR family transcriptional regulator [Celerinatantimonas yamalensis]|uniref:TetR/AcrR family transcriptional regulator n=1 Tax=Celerinatantimonas yamalensis TaxID=559956 RepID=A0ABW9G530_9GAMM
MTTKDVRHHILATAEQIISHKGFSAVGINELLRAANVPKGSFYHYFASKEAFGVALLKHYFDDYIDQLTQLFAADTNHPEQPLISYCQQWQHTQSCQSLTHRCLVVKLAAEVSDLSEAMRQVLNDGMQAIIEVLAGALSKTQIMQQLPGHPSAEQLAQRIYQLWLGASLQAKVYHSDEPFELAMATTQSWLQLA